MTTTEMKSALLASVTPKKLPVPPPKTAKSVIENKNAKAPVNKDAAILKIKMLGVSRTKPKNSVKLADLDKTEQGKANAKTWEKIPAVAKAKAKPAKSEKIKRVVPPVEARGVTSPAPKPVIDTSKMPVTSKAALALINKGDDADLPAFLDAKKNGAKRGFKDEKAVELGKIVKAKETAEKEKSSAVDKTLKVSKRGKISKSGKTHYDWDAAEAMAAKGKLPPELDPKANKHPGYIRVLNLVLALVRKKDLKGLTNFKTRGSSTILRYRLLCIKALKAAS
jgi:hypothetical protein